jgi:arylsulfatase
MIKCDRISHTALDWVTGRCSNASAVYFDGWLAGTVHKAPWETKPRVLLENDEWELYDARNDFSLANDLAATKPEKLAEMQKIFMREAIANHVLPIDDRFFERGNAALAGRPDLMMGRKSLTVYPGMFAISENAFINVKNTSFSTTA